MVGGSVLGTTQGARWDAVFVTKAKKSTVELDVEKKFAGYSADGAALLHRPATAT